MQVSGRSPSSPSSIPWHWNTDRVNLQQVQQQAGVNLQQVQLQAGSTCSRYSYRLGQPAAGTAIGWGQPAAGTAIGWGQPAVGTAIGWGQPAAGTAIGLVNLQQVLYSYRLRFTDVLLDAVLGIRNDLFRIPPQLLYFKHVQKL